jgi:hypothetical protein
MRSPDAPAAPARYIRVPGLGRKDCDNKARNPTTQPAQVCRPSANAPSPYRGAGMTGSPSVPTPSMQISTISPAFMNRCGTRAAPAGDRIAITSPGPSGGEAADVRNDSWHRKDRIAERHRLLDPACAAAVDSLRSEHAELVGSDEMGTQSSGRGKIFSQRERVGEPRPSHTATSLKHA